MATHQFKTEIHISATPERAWEVMADLPHWPEWTASISQMILLDPAPIAVGKRVKVIQPQLQPAVWKFTALEPNRGFEWTTGNFLVRMLAKHWIEPQADGVRLVLIIDVSGWLTGFVVRKFGKLTEEYMAMEANGLKARSEGKSV